jgi:hypothetical protein
MRFFLLALASSLLCSAECFCQQHFYYAPNSVNIPGLMKKNDASAGLGMGWGNDYFAIEAQGVYSPIQHGAVMLNYFDVMNSDVRRDVEVGTAFRFLEIGVGAYQVFERGSASIFAGGGQGNLYNFYGNDNFSRFTLRRWFLQPNVAYMDKNFRCGVALRLSRLSYPAGESSFDINEEDLSAIRKIEEDAPFFLPELGLTGGIEFRPFVFSVCLTSVFPDASGLRFARFNSSFILTFQFGETKKKKQENE